MLTFEEGTLRQENGVLAEVADVSGKSTMSKLKGAVVAAGKVRNGLEIGNGVFIKYTGPYPNGKQPRTLSAWLKQTAADPKWQSAVFYGAKGDAERTLFGIVGGAVWKCAVGVPGSIHRLRQTRRGTITASLTMGQRFGITSMQRWSPRSPKCSTQLRDH